MKRQGHESGFMLVGLIVAIFLILLVLGVAAPRVAKELRRDREVEAVHRGNQFVRAVQLYYRKTGHYPGSVEQLEKTNNIRFLRQRYVDPLTGKADWKLIHVGEAKTTVKGFFGQPLSGLTGANGIGGSSPGGSSSMGGSPGMTGASGASGGSSFGSSSFGSGAGSGTAGGSSGSSFGGASSSFGSGSAGSGTGVGTSGSGSSSGIGSQSATSFSGGGAPIMGVGSVAPGSSIVVLNEQTTYPTWEFIYDPRIEQLKAKAGLLGGVQSGNGASSPGFGSGAIGTPIGGPTGTGTGTGASGTGTGTSTTPR